MKSKNKNRIAFILICAIPTLAFLSLVLINILCGENWIDSDMAAEMIFAKQLKDEGRYICTPNWYYSTEFRILYTQLIMVPLFYVMKSWKNIRIITNIATYIIMALSYFYMMKPLKFDRRRVIAGLTVLFLPFSEVVMTHVQMGNTYMWHIILIYFNLGLILRIADFKAYKKGMLYINCILLAALSLICGMSGVRYLLALYCPAAVAAVLNVLKSREYNAADKQLDATNLKKVIASKGFAILATTIYAAVFSCVGYLINTKYISTHFEFQTYDTTNFIPVFQGRFLERLQDTFGSLLFMFGYIEDRTMVSLRGLICICSFVMPVLLAWICIRLYKSNTNRTLNDTNNSDEKWGFMYNLFPVSFAVNTFIFIFSNGTVVGRYYITVFILAIPIVIMFFSKEQGRLTKSLVLFVITVCLLLGSVKCGFSYIDKDKNAEKRVVAQFLNENNMNFGYATYNNANIITELSDGAVSVANLWNATERTEFHWSSPQKYYRDKIHDGAFLLLTDEEYEAVREEQFFNEGTLVFEKNGYKVFTFEDEGRFLNENP